MTVESIIDVRYPDCDQMQIVHHATYAIWYEMGRMDFFKACGYDYTYAHSRGTDPAMVSLEMNYGAPVTFPGTVRLLTRVVQCSGKKLSFEYQIFFGDADKPAATAKSFHIWVKDGKGYNIEEQLPEMFAAYHSAIEEVQSNV